MTRRSALAFLLLCVGQLLVGCAAMPERRVPEEPSPKQSQAQQVRLEFYRRPETLTAGREALVWIDIANDGASDVRFSADNALFYSVERSDGSGYGSDRVFRADCLQRHIIRAKGELILPLSVRIKEEGRVSITVHLSARQLDGDGQCDLERHFKGSTAPWAATVVGAE